MSFDRNNLGNGSSTALLEQRTMLAPATWDVTKTVTSRSQDYQIIKGNKRLTTGAFGWDGAGPGSSLKLSHNNAEPWKSWEVDFNVPNPTNLYSVKSYAHASQGWTWAKDFTPNSGFPIKHSPSLSKRVSFSYQKLQEPLVLLTRWLQHTVTISLEEQPIRAKTVALIGRS